MVVAAWLASVGAAVCLISIGSVQETPPRNAATRTALVRPNAWEADSGTGVGLAKKARQQILLQRLRLNPVAISPRSPAIMARASLMLVSSHGARRGPKLHAQTKDDFGEFKRLLATTGIDVDNLLRGLTNSPPGEGGPFIALKDTRPPGLDDQHWDELKQLASELPLASPLDQYELGSPFGARFDPINHQAAFHPGLDMDAPYASTVYSAGGGTVIFAGNMHSYGLVVEIDHGHSIVTRYAHLRRILVRIGESVQKHSPIAELGATGRTTGPHLHYEVRIDGSAIDPIEFMRLGGNPIQVSGRR